MASMIKKLMDAFASLEVDALEEADFDYNMGLSSAESAANQCHGLGPSETLEAVREGLRSRLELSGIHEGKRRAWEDCLLLLEVLAEEHGAA